MIKIKLLATTWKENGYDKEAVKDEAERLKNALNALYENNMMEKATLKKDLDNIKKAVEMWKKSK